MFRGRSAIGPSLSERSADADRRDLALGEGFRLAGGRPIRGRSDDADRREQDDVWRLRDRTGTTTRAVASRRSASERRDVPLLPEQACERDLVPVRGFPAVGTCVPARVRGRAKRSAPGCGTRRARFRDRPRGGIVPRRHSRAPSCADRPRGRRAGPVVERIRWRSRSTAASSTRRRHGGKNAAAPRRPCPIVKILRVTRIESPLYRERIVDGRNGELGGTPRAC